MKQFARSLALFSLVLLAFGAIAVATTGCQTVKGVGEDIQNVGEAGEEAISDDA